MRRTRILLNSQRYAEELSKTVDKSIDHALNIAYQQEKAEQLGDVHDKASAAARVASTPELADVFLTVNTKLGQEQILIRPTSGQPTGLTDIHQHPAPRETLVKIYDHTLAYLADKFPSTSVYRQSVESIIKARKDIVQNNTDVTTIENQIGSGLLEEILLQAADEFLLAETLAQHQVWESLEEPPLEDQWVPHAYKDQKQ